ncbi:MAG TPA: S8 family serine peptidase [Candidatus Krumholzibacteria bacterium]|nr:S8 family serine peptidase [Candidatus Krumholzibacteria bacterium]
MHRFKNVFSLGAILVCTLLILPSLHPVDAKDGAKQERVAPGLQKQLDAAGSDELITAIVKVRSVGPPPQANLGRAQVFDQLRQNAKASQAQLRAFLNQPAVKADVGIVREFWLDNLVLVQARKSVIDQIARRSDVERVFDNYTVNLPPRTPGDPEPLAHQSQPWDNIAFIGAKQVWNSYGLRGAGVRVGGLDTGVDIAHPDIAGKMITTNPADPTYPGGWAEFDGNGNVLPGSVPHDSDQHGTHTTGTMIGGSASGFDVGVAPEASLLHGLVIPGGSGSFAQVVGGMEWIIDPDGNPATDDGAQVVNMSLGATGTFPEMVAPTDNMVLAGVFPSFSIGNSGPGASTTGSPGNVPSAFGVGATDNQDVIASFSSRGPVTWNVAPYIGTYTKPDISAPGVQIFSTVPGGEWEWSGAGFTWSGTSMASPHVAGTVALMRQANPSMSVAEIKQILAQTSIDLGSAGMDNNYGWGRVNAFAAVSAALVGVGTLDGTVTSMGAPVAGALILVTDTGQRVSTDASGHYSLRIVAGDHDIDASRFGYQTASASVSIVADVTTTQDFDLTQLPSGAIAGTVTDSQSGMGVAADISVKLGGQVVVTSSTDPVSGVYSITLPVGTYDLVFNASFPYPSTSRLGIGVLEAMTTTVDVVLMPAEILIVDDDAGSGFETYYQQAITAAGRSYLTVGTPPTAAQMNQFDAVVWLTGNDYTTTLTATDQAEVAAFLDGGGRLFMSGQDIGYDIKTDAFYADYLHAAFVQDDVGLGGVYGNLASPVGTGLAFEIQGGSGANNQAYPSEIDPVGGAQSAFFYDGGVPGAPVAAGTVTKAGGSVGANAITSSGTAGLSYEGVYRLVYFAFGFEAIADVGDRAAVMDRVLDWLQGFPEIAHTPLGDTEDTTHPYTVTAVITSDYFALDTGSFAVVYSTGGADHTVAMAPTGGADEYSADIPPQPLDTEVEYYVQASDVEGHTSTHPLGAPVLRHHFAVGKDMVPPEIAHTRLFDTNDLTGPYVIRAEVTDNIGVESVYLLYSKNGGLYHRVKMHPPDPIMPAAFVGEIPGPSEVGDEYDYYLLAMDESYSGNATRLPETGTFQFTIVEEFVWDFEMDDGGFTPGGGVWEWGTPTSGPGGAHSGANLWGTVLGGTYPSSSNATLDLPAITLAADRPYSVLSFWHWYNMENRYDGGNVKVSTDGGATFSIITPAGGYDDVANSGNAGIAGEPCFTNIHEAWQQETFDLSAFAGQQVIIRLHFGSDSSVNRSGWYVDDVRLRSSDTDDVPPTISNVVVPASSFNTAGPYAVSASVDDLFSGVAGVSLYYSLDGGGFTQVGMTHGAGNSWSASIPGQPNGTRVNLYLQATDNAGNATASPATAPGDTYAFAILPSADILAIVYSTGGATVDDYRAALEANGHAADYWNQPTQGALTAAQLQLYKMVIIDSRSGISASDQTNLSTFLNSGSAANKKRIFLLGRDLGFSSTTRGWISQFMRADYVQDNPSFFEITGEPGDPIGMGETFVIAGSYPDEVQRSTAYPGGVVVYRYTGPGSASASYGEIRDEYEKESKEWDGVMPDAPKSLDAAAGIRYNGATYRSMYLTFNLDYIQEASRRAAILDRVVKWTAAPDIVHAPLSDTEDTSSPYVVTAQVYSSNLDPSRVRLTYDLGAGATTVTMLPTANPNEYAASIPAQPFGTTVQYYLSAANLDGSTSYHPDGAPAEQHVFHVISDNIPPEIAHTPPQYSADTAGPYAIGATITDNVGVDPAGVSLVYNKNGGSNQTIAMAPQGGDEYAASIPGPSVVGDTYNYYILARDLATVPNTGRSPATGSHTLQIVDFFVWDFEADNGGFASTGPDWEWGSPSSGPGGANSGVNLWATKLGANYSSSSNSRLESPAVIVPSSKTFAQLTFWHWYDTEQNYDGGNVKLSSDGGATWTILTPDVGYSGTATSGNAAIPGEPCFSGHGQKFWQKVTFDITAYKGQSVVIRWHFGSDSSVQYPGWYVDDVRLEGVDDTAGPSFVSRSIPLSTFDEVGPYTVKATVVDALSGLAGVDMHYSTNAGATYTTVAMSPTANPNEYSGDIPGQPSHTRIKVYMEAADNSGNHSTDPADAPTTTHEFGILPSGDYLVIVGGTAETSPALFQDAFATLGRTYDIWDWDASGVPPQALLNAYQAIVVDESFYFDAAQIAALTTFLDTDDGSRQRIFMLGRDLSYGSSARPFMEQYTGAAYVQDNPAWYQLTSALGDPIGADETFTISGSYPDELKFSATYPGAQTVYRYTGVGSAADRFETAQEFREFYEKEGKAWDPKLWPFAPTGPDSLAGVRYVGTHHAAVYFAFNLYYIQEPARRAAVLGRALDWLDTATTIAVNSSGPSAAPTTSALLPEALSLAQNYPNPFNPVTHIKIGIPVKFNQPVSLRIYNVRGQLVKTVFTGVKPAGFHSFAWDGTNDLGSPVATGVYFANLVAGDAKFSRKMVLLK